MARPGRMKIEEAAFYHIYNRVAGSVKWMPFQEAEAREQLMKLILFHLRGCFCQLASFVIMGNHFHLVLWLEKFRELTRAELMEKARYFYGPNWEAYTRRWSEEQWQRFNRRLFDVSRIMQVLQSQYAKWYNRTHGRRGRFWGDRFKSNLALDLETTQQFVFYTELNPVRASLVPTPEEWTYSSARDRYRDEDQHLMALSELFPEAESNEVFEFYRQRLLYLGYSPGRENQASLPEWVIKREQKRGFKRPGAYLKRRRCFNDGLVSGPADKVKQVIEDLREKQIYLRRTNPISQMGGVIYTLREQRSRGRS